MYQGSVPVHTSAIYNLHDSARHFTMSLGERGLALRGDILVKCYHRHRQPVDGRETIFSLQFHTCAVTQHTLVFQRQDLDDACQGAFQYDQTFLFFYNITNSSNNNNNNKKKQPPAVALSLSFRPSQTIPFRSDRYRG